MYSKESAPLTGGYQAQAYPSQPGYTAYPPQPGYAPQQQQAQQGGYAYEGKQVDQAMPVMGVPTQDQMQTRTPCNDLWAALLFLGHVIAVVAVAITCGREWSTVSTTEGSWSSSGETGSGVQFDGHLTRHAMLLGLGVGGGFSAVAVVLFLVLMRLFPKFFVWVANLLVIGLYTAVAVYYKTWLMLIPVAFMVLWLFLVRKRVPLAALLLGTASRLVFKYWGGFLVSLFGLVIKAVYFIAWGFAVIFVFYRHDIGKLSDGGLYGATAAFVFMGFWTIYVVQGIVRVTISGAIASWYFFGENNGPSMPTASSFKRAMTTSFGSICFGAAIVAVLSLLRSIARSMRGRNNAFVQCLCECFLGLLESMMQYFNAYAFTHIAIYGATYIESAKLTWRFMSNFLFSAIINDNLYTSVISIITLGNMIWIPVVAAHITHNGWSVLIAVLVTFAVHIVTIFTVPMAITALFVCIAENGEVLAINHPQLKAELDVAIAILNENPCMC